MYHVLAAGFELLVYDERLVHLTNRSNIGTFYLSQRRLSFWIQCGLMSHSSTWYQLYHEMLSHRTGNRGVLRAE